MNLAGMLVLAASPMLAQQAVNFYSPAKEQAMGRALADEIQRMSTPVNDPSVDAYMTALQAELTSARAAGDRDSPAEYRFEVVTGLEASEPTALPGGHVFIPAVAFLRAQNEAELAGVVTHAMGHVALRHATRAASRGKVANTASIPTVFMGGASGMHADSSRSRVLVPAAMLPVQRTFEIEADAYAVRRASAAGFDVSAYRRYVERTHPEAAVSTQSGLPSREERLARIDEALREVPAAPAASDEEFRAVQQTSRRLISTPEVRKAPTLRR